MYQYGHATFQQQSVVQSDSILDQWSKLSDPNYQCNRPGAKTSIHIAAQFGCTKQVQERLKEAIDINARDKVILYSYCCHTCCIDK
jgi:hypothetical protein